jgi:flagellar hook-associated protein 1
MLPPLNAILAIGVSSLQSHQTALATTSHNISNSTTEGYTRQRVNLESQRPLPVTPGQLGLGVQVTDIKRMRDAFLDGTVRLQIAQNARYDFAAKNQVMLETALGPVDGGINKDLSNFFNSIQSLTTSPEDLGVRQNVIDNAAILAGSFRNTIGSLDRAEGSVDVTVDDAARDINSMLDQVAILNREIQKFELGTDNANDFRDKRDLLVDKLSAYFDVTQVELPTGAVNLSVNGEPLVTGLVVSPVQVVSAGTPAHPQIQSSGGVNLVTSGGKLRGIAEVYTTIDGLRTQLDDLAATIIDEVNTRVTGGFDLNGNAGVNFFSGTDAATIDVSAAVKANPALVVAAGVAAPGDNQVALDLVALQDLAVFPSAGPNSTLGEGIRNILSQLGSQTRNTMNLAETYQNGLKLVSDQRQAVSGVNMDEELSNLISYQRAYEAAARVVTIVDEMLDTIINRMAV